MDIGVHHLDRNGVACIAAVKGGAAGDVLQAGGQLPELAFGVGSHCLAGAADQRGCAGVGFQVAAPATGAQRRVLCVTDDHMPQLRRSAGIAGQQLAFDHNAAADTGAQGQDDRTVRAFGAAGQRFAVGRSVRIVGQADRQAELCLQVGPHRKVGPRQIVGIQHGTGCIFHRAGAANADTGDRVVAGHLTAERGNVIADSLCRAGQVGGAAALTQDVAGGIHQRNLDVGTAKIDSECVHGMTSWDIVVWVMLRAAACRTPRRQRMAFALSSHPSTVSAAVSRMFSALSPIWISNRPGSTRQT